MSPGSGPRSTRGSTSRSSTPSGAQATWSGSEPRGARNELAERWAWTTRGRIMTALGKLFRTTAFKLSFAYLLIFTVFAFVSLGYVAWSAQRLLNDQFVSTIEAE